MEISNSARQQFLIFHNRNQAIHYTGRGQRPPVDDNQKMRQTSLRSEEVVVPWVNSNFPQEDFVIALWRLSCWCCWPCVIEQPRIMRETVERKRWEYSPQWVRERVRFWEKHHGWSEYHYITFLTGSYHARKRVPPLPSEFFLRKKHKYWWSEMYEESFVIYNLFAGAIYFATDYVGLSL